MSSLYNLEPQPTAKVLLTTTSGDLLLELFAKQTPLASRNFLQHCLDGYYDGTIFHRLVPGFVIQGGDPTGTGQGGEAAIVSGGTFDDEFHSRLKYNRRGLLGMANGGGKNDNGSQFFLTLAATPELQGKNTMFGRLVGDTIFNLMKMADAELDVVEGSERPLYPTKVTGAEILVNPFDDMVKRDVKVRHSEDKREQDRKKKTKKGKGGKMLLSFGNEEGDGEEPVVVSQKNKVNPALIATASDFAASAPKATVRKEENEQAPASEKKLEKSIRKRSSRSLSPKDPIPNPKTQLPIPKDEEPSRSPSTSPEPTPVDRMTSLLDKTNAQIADLKASMRRNVAAAPSKDVPSKKSALEQMMPQNAIRGGKRKRGANGDSESNTMDLLNAFRSKLESVAPETKPGKSSSAAVTQAPNPKDSTEDSAGAAVKDEEAELCDLHFIANCQSCQKWDELGAEDVKDDDKDLGWMSHALNLKKDRLGKDLSWKQKNEEELMVIDPREKARDIKEEQRAKKMARMGGKAGYVTEWGKDRDRRRTPVKLAGEKMG